MREGTKVKKEKGERRRQGSWWGNMGREAGRRREMGTWWKGGNRGREWKMRGEAHGRKGGRSGGTGSGK